MDANATMEEKITVSVSYKARESDGITLAEATTRATSTTAENLCFLRDVHYECRRLFCGLLSQQVLLNQPTLNVPKVISYA